MRKISLISFIVFAVILISAAGALSIIPHSHGTDLGHSQHSSCAVYQLEVHGFQAIVAASLIILSIGYAIIACQIDFVSRYLNLHNLKHTRAPPYIFF